MGRPCGPEPGIWAPPGSARRPLRRSANYCGRCSVFPTVERVARPAEFRPAGWSSAGPPPVQPPRGPGRITRDPETPSGRRFTKSALRLFSWPPTEFRRLPEFGIGLTDICKVRHGSDEEIGTSEFDVVGLKARIVSAEPALLAFNGKNAARGALECSVDYGLQPERVGAHPSGCCHLHQELPESGGT